LNLYCYLISKFDYFSLLRILSINWHLFILSYLFFSFLLHLNFPCIIDYSFKNLKHQIKKANELGVLIVLVIGPKEAEIDKVSIKNMATEEQKIIDIGELIDEIYNIIDEYGS